MYPELQFQGRWHRPEERGMSRSILIIQKVQWTSTEAILEDKYKLTEAIIASAKNESELKEEIAFYASDYILRVLKNHMTLALTRGCDASADGRISDQ